jgi:NADP-dependent 3-hydroxy acid dehydrogenase YdfG
MTYQKSALVTGATSGIGRATAIALSQADYRVIATGRNQSALDELHQQHDIQTIRADLAQTHQIDALFSEAGKIDILINAAGVAPFAKIIDGSLDAMRQLLDINVLALTACCQKALRAFDPETGGQIINVSSMSGHRVPPSGGFYAATKFAVRAISEALRHELRADGNPTRVACISPGFVDTPLLDTYFKGKEEQLSNLKSDLRMLTTDDIAQSILHILNAPPHVDFTDILLRPSDQKT